MSSGRPKIPLPMIVLMASAVRLQRLIARTRPGDPSAVAMLRGSGYHAAGRRLVADLWQAIGAMTVHSRSRLDRNRRWYHVGGVAGSFVVLLAIAASARTAPAPASQAAQPAPNTAALVAQGEYLTTRVAMCV